MIFTSDPTRGSGNQGKDMGDHMKPPITAPAWDSLAQGKSVWSPRVVVEAPVDLLSIHPDKVENSPKSKSVEIWKFTCPILCAVFQSFSSSGYKEILGQACQSHANQTSHQNVHKANNK